MKEALLEVVRAGEPAGAVASAARTLLEHFGNEGVGDAMPVSSMSEAELDAELARTTPRKTPSAEE